MTYIKRFWRWLFEPTVIRIPKEWMEVADRFEVEGIELNVIGKG